jgi:hypothetical protein
MSIRSDKRQGQMQDVLRSVGALLDLVSARGVVVRQDGDRLVIGAQVAATLADRLEGRWSPLGRVLTPRHIARLRAEAVARRGSGHVAGPHERSLRMIGRHVDERSLSDITLIEQESESRWLLWHRDDVHERPVLILLEDDELRLADASATEARLAREARAPLAATRSAA